MKLSIIIPVYNVEKYIGRCLNSIESVLKSGSSEIIIVNDGSTDTSVKEIESFASIHSNTKYIEQENAGQSAARNRGLDIAAGDYVWFIDSDDYIDNKEVRRIIERLEAHEPDVVCFGRVEEHGAWNVRKPKIEKEQEFTSGQEYFEYSVQNGTFRTTPWDKIFKKRLLDEHNLKFIEGLPYEDMYFCLQAFMFAQSVSVVPFYPYHYVMYNATSTTKLIKNRDLAVIKFIHYAYDFILKGDFAVKTNSQSFQLLIFTWVSSCLMNKYAYMSLTNVQADHIVKSALADEIFMNSVRYCARHRVAFRQHFFAKLLLFSCPLYKVILHLSLKIQHILHK